jgi:hypothetical protein
LFYFRNGSLDVRFSTSSNPSPQPTPD